MEVFGPPDPARPGWPGSTDPSNYRRRRSRPSRAATRPARSAPCSPGERVFCSAPSVLTPDHLSPTAPPGDHAAHRRPHVQGRQRSESAPACSANTGAGSARSWRRRRTAVAAVDWHGAGVGQVGAPVAAPSTVQTSRRSRWPPRLAGTRTPFRGAIARSRSRGTAAPPAGRGLVARPGAKNAEERSSRSHVQRAAGCAPGAVSRRRAPRACRSDSPAPRCAP